MERIIRTLLRNRDELWKAGIEVPSPRRYRGVYGEALAALKGGTASDEMQEMLLDAVMDSDEAARVVLSQSGFIGLPKRAITTQGVYAFAHHRMTGLSNLFPDSSVEFFVGILHPARHVQTIVEMSKGNYGAVMDGIDLDKLRWAPMFRRFLSAVPGRTIVTWAQEDLPFIWPEVLRRMAGVDNAMPLLDEDVILAELLSPEALSELKQSITEEAAGNISARRDLVEYALASADAGALEAELTLPGWTQDLVDQLSEIYAADLAEIAALSGVEFISA